MGELEILRDFRDLECPPEGLETLESFLRACGISPEQMEAASNNMPKVPPAISYQNGDEHTFYLEMFEAINTNWLLRKLVKGVMDSMNEKMLYQRNRAWVKKISEFPAEPKSLITVGG